MSAISRPFWLLLLVCIRLAAGLVAPTNEISYRNAVSVTGSTATFHYAGADGTLDYRWVKPGPQDSLLGNLRLRAMRAGGGVNELAWSKNARAEWTTPARFIDSEWKADGAGALLRLRYSLGTLRFAVRPQGKALSVDVDCEQPLLRVLDMGGWELQRGRKLEVPYDPFDSIYYPEQKLFASAYFDWTDSHATTQAFPKLVYGALTDGSRNAVHDRVIIAASWHLQEIFANQPHAPSKYLARLAGRTVLDIWGGRFDEIAKQIEVLRDHGIGNCVALIHDWQRDGYDNGLPAQYPAAEKLGGDTGLRGAIAAAKKSGCYAGVHENYVDYYPNYEHFDEREISRTSKDELMKAWFNPGTKIQSFASKPNLMIELAARESPEIHRRYGTDASFLDVNSSVVPWWRADMEKGEPGAGMLSEFRDRAAALWEYLGRTHDGPVFGEGNHQFFWSGALDGVEAQWGTRSLLVDFDLLKIHPLQANHGMGYYERWSKAGVDPQKPEQLDAYRMQEVAFGHQPFLGGSLWSEVPIAWVEQNLIGPVAKRYGMARVTTIRYMVDGAWVDTDAAADVADWSRVQVRYDNGDTITANAAREPLQDGDLTLPQYGWSARGPGLLAYTALKQGIVVDYAETGGAVFANPRNPLDGLAAAQARVSAFRQTGPRAFAVTFEWMPERTPAGDYQAFVHFQAAVSGAQARPAFQGDHALERSPSQWASGEAVVDGPRELRIPAGVADGDYRMMAGLYGAGGGGRLWLDGEDDGTLRYLLGVLTIADGGSTISFRATAGPPRGTGPLIDFGTVKTDGSVRMVRDGDGWILKPLNRNRSLAVTCSKQYRCTGR